MWITLDAIAPNQNKTGVLLLIRSGCDCGHQGDLSKDITVATTYTFFCLGCNAVVTLRLTKDRLRQFAILHYTYNLSALLQVIDGLWEV